jgi:histidine triad (HIT) family protein
MSTIFQKIIAREIPAKIVAESDSWIAFHDIAPQAPVHVLVVPKKLIPRVGEASPEDESLLGQLLLATRQVAETLGIAKTGFRVVINHGRDGGESVPHLHVHVLGGRPLGWPPG